MWLKVEVLCAFVIILVTFADKRLTGHRFKHLKIALGLFALIQIIIYMLGVMVFYFTEKYLSEDAQIILASSILLLTITGAFIASLYYARKSIKRYINLTS